MTPVTPFIQAGHQASVVYNLRERGGEFERVHPGASFDTIDIREAALAAGN